MVTGRHSTDPGRSVLWQRSCLGISLFRAHIGEMPREKFETLLRCPMCERTGLAEMSNASHSNAGDYDTRIEAVPEGFEIKGNDVICSDCRISALCAAACP
jgi:hypothetical protein